MLHKSNAASEELHNIRAEKQASSSPSATAETAIFICTQRLYATTVEPDTSETTTHTRTTALLHIGLVVFSRTDSSQECKSMTKSVAFFNNLYRFVYHLSNTGTVSGRRNHPITNKYHMTS